MGHNERSHVTQQSSCMMQLRPDDAQEERKQTLVRAFHVRESGGQRLTGATCKGG